MVSTMHSMKKGHPIDDQKWIQEYFLLVKEKNDGHTFEEIREGIDFGEHYFNFITPHKTFV